MVPLSQKRLFLLDMDGTIYLDNELFPAAKPFLDYVRSLGGRYLFLTNNSSRSVDAYVEKLQALGIEATSEDFLTSVNALIAYLKQRKPYQLCYAFGTESFRAQLRAAGIPVTDKLEDGIDCLLIAFDTELNFRKLEDACILLNRGVDFIATNPDWVCPTWYGYVPDCGSFCEMLYRATGRKAKFIGKPEPDMALICMERFGCSPEETVIIGDRIYTDIACGVNAGCTSILVLSGETRREDMKNYDITPTFVFDDIRAVLDEMKK